jgi:predicted permease
MLMAAALLVLILACANVGNLVLARASASRDEMETRAALGATRRDIVLHYLRDAVLLALAGTLLGVAISARVIDVVAALRPASLPDWNDLALDVRALAAAAAALFIAAIVAGLVPAIAATRTIDRGGAHGRFGVGGERGRGVRRVLTAAQVALAVVLLVGAALLMRSILAVQNVATGFETESRFAATLELPDTVYDRPREIAFFTRYLDRVRALPGVVSAGGVSALPLHGSGVDYDTDVYVEGARTGDRAPEAAFRVATPDYFRTMGIPLVRGREILPSDDRQAARVAVVNEAFVRSFLGSRDPLGVGIRVYCEECERAVIVGVVRDTRHRGLDRPVTPEIYIPFTQEPHGTLTIVVATRGDSRGVAAAMPRELVRLDPDLALANMATVEDIVSRSIEERRFNARLLAAFSGCALLLAAIGLYGSLSFSIAQRRQEIAIRVALGAARANLWRLVLIEASRPVFFGALAGVGAAAIGATFLRAMLFGVTAADPLSYLVVMATFAAVVLVVALIGFIRVTATDVRALLADA